MWDKMSEVRVRPYQTRDRAAVREIAWQTAFMGRPADVFFSDKLLFEDFLTLYFTDYEPESCFVAETKEGVAGYLIGARDERRIGEVTVKKIVPRLLLRLFVRDLFSPKDMYFCWRLIISALRGEFRGQDFYRSYPAVLHINLKEAMRGKGVGSRLIAAYTAYLMQARCPGVHLATMSPDAGAFFERQGFVLLSRRARSYFRTIAGGDIEVRIYGKQLIS
jgi:GNAT superfamily N-acetyltransferase